MASDPKQEPNLSMNPRIERDREMLVEARKKGRGSLFGVFVRLSGPGWLQSAITLGGGSLSSSLYLGVLGGFMFLWLQPVAMVAGIVMLSAIAYVTLSTGQRPLRAINAHVSPILGWGWLFASMTANLVWSLPQFALATASFRQNLFPQVFGDAGLIPDPFNKLAVALIILCITLTMGMVYSIGGRGMKAFEIIVKCLVGLNVACFIGVVVTLTTSGAITWGAIASGFVPRLSLLSQPVPAFREYIAAVPEAFQGFWSSMIVGQQRDVMISAAATAVGINMTFLFPYSMLRKGWDRDFRGLAIFDLSTGLFFPFLFATSCVVIAAASQFNAVPARGIFPQEGQTVNAEGQIVDASGEVVAPDPALLGRYNALLGKRLAAEYGADVATWTPEEKTARAAALPESDKIMASMLVSRDAFDLSSALVPLTGKRIARYVFGLGILGMGMGAATMLMLINGLCFCELLNKPAKGWPQRFGMALVSIGVLGPFFWGTSNAQMWIAIPTSVFAMTLLPFAYFTFFLLMNQKQFLGESMPRGGKRLLWNTLMGIAAVLAAFGSLWSLWSKIGVWGILIFVGFFGIVTLDYIRRRSMSSPA